MEEALELLVNSVLKMKGLWEDQNNVSHVILTIVPLVIRKRDTSLC